MIGPGAKKASQRWIQAVTNHFDFRWCVLALKKQKLLPAWMDHFDIELYDILYDITKHLGIEDQVCCTLRFEGTNRLLFGLFAVWFCVRHFNFITNEPSLDYFPNLCYFAGPA